MNSYSVLLLGIGLGLRHATDADHVVVVSALVQREPGVWKAARIAALWGVGHTAAFLAIGFFILLAGLRMPEIFEPLVDALVGFMLVGFGLWHVLSHGTGNAKAPAHRSLRGDARPIAIGVVHGLAGSAGIALLAATTIDSRATAAGYLLLFGAGTIAGMVALTVLIARPLSWAMQRGATFRRWLIVGAGGASMALGASILVATFVEMSR